MSEPVKAIKSTIKGLYQPVDSEGQKWGGLVSKKVADMLGIQVEED